jgi:AcrR family transcriptional regulator
MAKRENHGSTKGRLLEIATRLFSSNGFVGTTIREISRECGVSEAAVYKHFASKKDLYEEAIRSKTRKHKIQDYLDSLKGKGTIEEVLFSLAGHIIKTARKDPGLIRMMLFSSLEGFSVSTILFKEFRYPYIRFLREELIERIDQGEVRKVNPYISARCFVGMVMDCALNSELWNNLESKSFSPEAVAKNNIPIYARGLAAL